MKRNTYVYLIVAIAMISLSSYLYNTGYTMGKQFHELSSLQRIMIRIQGVFTLLISPFSAAFDTFFPNKVLFNTSVWWDISMYLGIIPSYFLYVKIFHFNVRKANY